MSIRKNWVVLVMREKGKWYLDTLFHCFDIVVLFSHSFILKKTGQRPTTCLCLSPVTPTNTCSLFFYLDVYMCVFFPCSVSHTRPHSCGSTYSPCTLPALCVPCICLLYCSDHIMKMSHALCNIQWWREKEKMHRLKRTRQGQGFWETCVCRPHLAWPGALGHFCICHICLLVILISVSGRKRKRRVFSDHFVVLLGDGCFYSFCFLQCTHVVFHCTTALWVWEASPPSPTNLPLDTCTIPCFSIPSLDPNLGWIGVWLCWFLCCSL